MRTPIWQLHEAKARFSELFRRVRTEGPQRVVNVYNWSDYVAPGVIDDFSRETGIKLRYDTFDSNDTLETKLLAGKSGYDVVVPTADDTFRLGSCEGNHGPPF